MSRYKSIYIIIIVLIIVFIATLFIPSGMYINGEFSYIDNDLSNFEQFLLSPLNGLLGRNNNVTISFLNQGQFSGVFFLCALVLSIYSYTKVVEESKILNNYLIGNISKIKKRENIFILILILFFSLCAFTHGMYETTVGFSAILFIVAELLGFKKIYMVMIILFSVSIGHIGSTINPFATQVASELAGVSLSEGFTMRMVLFVVLLVITYIYLIRVKYKYKISVNNTTYSFKKVSAYKVLLIFLPFLIMTYSFLPFELPLKLSVNMIILMFLFSSLIICKFNFKSFVINLYNCFKACLVIFVVLSISRGIYVMMYNLQINDTIIYYLTNLISGRSFLTISFLYLIFFLLITIVIPSTTAVAFLSIPVLSGVNNLIGYSNSQLVTLYQTGMGIMQIFSFTSVVVLLLISDAQISYKEYIKNSYKYIMLISIVSFTIILIF